jgi:hypothetical protein
MQVRLVGRVEMPNSKTYDLTGCFVGLEAYGDVSSERAIVRTRISAASKVIRLSISQFQATFPLWGKTV